ncbi:hypothetical protein HU200_057648 [Digitaria exilis]|uniref:Uncharacterized protein n=1 Tax=Digitaria exilis TaxID=1010633 RepID=A0A835ADN1_9POAL|nr:hypothetical protein HU200_057648 [Digitaria exilis]
MEACLVWPTSVMESVYFLLKFRESIEQGWMPDSAKSVKGKDHYRGFDNKAEKADMVEKKKQLAWKPPPDGCTKEKSIFSAWRVLWRCASADKAEAWACAEGVQLASEWAQVKAMLNKEDRSQISFILS